MSETVTTTGYVAPAIIPPTPGRMVFFYASDKQSEPFAATVAKVWNERMINIGYLDHNGHHSNATSVPFIHPGDQIPDLGFYCTWPSRPDTYAQVVNAAVQRPSGCEVKAG